MGQNPWSRGEDNQPLIMQLSAACSLLPCCNEAKIRWMPSSVDLSPTLAIFLDVRTRLRQVPCALLAVDFCYSACRIKTSLMRLDMML